MQGVNVDLTYKLHLRDGRGRSRTVLYKPHVSEAIWEDSGKPLPVEHIAGGRIGPTKFADAEIVHPTQPGLKKSITTLKIQLGMKCNYTCLYCNQASTRHDVYGDADEAMTLLQEIPKFFDAGPNGDGEDRRVEFWGGEPFVYWKILRWFVPALRQSYPKAHFNIITNGSLLDQEKIDWIVENDLGINVSHDGPGHKKTRGPDPFDDPENAHWLRVLWDKLGPDSELGKLHGGSRLGFGCVLTRENYSLWDIRLFIADKLGIPPEKLNLTTEEIVLPYDEGGLSLSPENDAAYQDFVNAQFLEAVSGRSMGVFAVNSKISRFAKTLAQHEPVTANGQKCGMDRSDTLATNLSGQVTTCHNLSAGTKHEIGHVSALEDVRLNTSYHFSTREECMKCPVVQLCQGACMFLEGDLWTKACDNSYAWNTAMLAASLYYLTGMTLVEIEGDVIRRQSLPQRHPVITKGAVPARAHLR